MRIGFNVLLSILLIFIFNFGNSVQGYYSAYGKENTVKKNFFKDEMKNFVKKLSFYAKKIKKRFLIIPQNGNELLTESGEEYDNPDMDYIKAIDGIGREDLFYGYKNDNISTPNIEKDYMISFLEVAVKNNIKILVTDYCWSKSKIDKSYYENNNRGYLSFAADHRELDNIPHYPTNPYNINSSNILTLNEAKNFLYIINPENYKSKKDFINNIKSTNYDLIIIDLFYKEMQLTAVEINSLKVKANGGRRLIIAYMSIGEAEDYRYYWNTDWSKNPPSWLTEENPEWEGNYKVKYWHKEWQKIIFGNNNSYLKKIINSGFDGVYLDIIDAFEYFEN